MDLGNFLEEVFVEPEDGEHILLAQALGEGKGFRQFTLDDADLGRLRRSRLPLYVNCCTVDGLHDEGKSFPGRSRAHCVRAHVIVCDDIGTKVDIDKMPPPSYTIETSPGNWQYGYFIDPTPDIEAVTALTRALAANGMNDPGSVGANRLVRVPSSINIKPAAEGHRARVDVFDTGKSWPLEELIEHFGLTADIVAEHAVPTPPDATDLERIEGIDPVVNWLQERGMVLTRPGPSGWMDITCPWNAEEGCHTTGPEAGYNPLGYGERPQSRGFHCMHGHKEKISTADFLKWVADNDGPDVPVHDPIPWLQRRFVYIRSEQRVADIDQMPKGGFWLMKFLDFKGGHAPGTVNKIATHIAWRDHPNTVHVDRVAYEPGAGVLCEVDGQRCVNSWAPPIVPETEDEPATFLEHMSYLLPTASERKLFLDWLAYKLQHPGQRSYALVMVAERAYGVGRSWLHHLLNRMLGDSVKPATLADLIGRGGQWNDWAARSQFVVVEEAKDVKPEDYYHGYETFKQYVDPAPTKFTLSSKYNPTSRESMYFNVLILTNHSDALLLPENDRRVAVVTNPTQQRDPDYYEDLWASLDDGEAERVYWHLMRRDVSKFNPARPPMTPGKAEMIRAAVDDDPAEELWTWLVDSYPTDLITKEGLHKFIDQQCRSDATLQDVSDKQKSRIKRDHWRRLRRLREGKDGYRRRDSHGRVREVRALRNVDDWRRHVEIKGSIIEDSDIDLPSNVAVFPNKHS